MPRTQKRRSRRGQPPQVRKSVVIQVCLYPGDLQKLDRLTKGRGRLRSTILRYLIRSCDRINEIDLQATMREDGLLKDLSVPLIKIPDLQGGE